MMKQNVQLREFCHILHMHDETGRIYWIGMEQDLMHLDQLMIEAEYNQVDDVDSLMVEVEVQVNVF